MNHWLSLYWSILVVTYFGALCGHVLSLYSPKFKGLTPFLEKFLPGKSATIYFRLDFFILPIIGTFLAFNLLEPANIKTALFAGMTWSGSLLAILNTSGRQNPKKRIG